MIHIDPLEGIWAVFGCPLPYFVLNIMCPKYNWCLGIFSDNIEVGCHLQRFELNDIIRIISQDLSYFLSEGFGMKPGDMVSFSYKEMI